MAVRRVVAFTFSLCVAAVQRDSGGVMKGHHDLAPKHRIDTRGQATSQAKEQLAKIAEQVDAAQHLESAHMMEMKARWENQLQEKNRENNLLATQIENKSLHLNAMELTNVNLRRDAEKIMVENEQLRSMIQYIRSNLSIAEEFMNNTEDVSKTMAVAPEVAVLSDLARQEAASNKEPAGLAGIFNDLNSAKAHVSMLQRVREHELDAGFESLMQGLATKLEEVSKAKAASEASMEAAFQETFDKASERHDALVARIAELDQALSAAEQLKSQLDAAVKQLQTTHQMLVDNFRSIHTFSKGLAALTEEWSQSSEARKSTESDAATADEAKHQGPSGKDGKSKTGGLSKVFGRLR